MTDADECQAVRDALRAAGVDPTDLGPFMGRRRRIDRALAR
jgi:hypothetical protein